MRVLRWLIPILVIGALAYFVRTSYRTWITTEVKPTMAVDPAQIRLEVLNASGIASAGRDVREYLTRNGFDVYDDKKDDEIRPRTRIVDRSDSTMKYAREVQKFLTIPGRKMWRFPVTPRLVPEVAAQPEPLLMLEATVWLGADYRKFFPVEPRPF